MSKGKGSVISKFVTVWLVIFAICLAIVTIPGLFIAFVNWDAGMVGRIMDVLAEGRVLRMLALFAALMALLFSSIFKD